MIDQHIFSAGKRQPRRKQQPPSRKTAGLKGRCLRMAKQQKTRAYILYRCTHMLLCWHEHSVSD